MSDLKIDEKTHVTLKMVQALLLVVIIGTGWAVRQEIALGQAQADIKDLRDEQKETQVHRDELKDQIHSVEIQVVAVREYFHIPKPQEAK